MHVVCACVWLFVYAFVQQLSDTWFSTDQSWHGSSYNRYSEPALFARASIRKVFRLCHAQVCFTAVATMTWLPALVFVDQLLLILRLSTLPNLSGCVERTEFTNQNNVSLYIKLFQVRFLARRGFSCPDSGA